MGKWSLIFIFPLLFCSFQCGKDEVLGCVNDKLEQFQTECCNQGASLNKYHFQNDLVYKFDMGTCGNDLTMIVINQNCDTLGYLGGIAGNEMINGEPFSNAHFIETIWSN